MSNELNMVRESIIKFRQHMTHAEILVAQLARTASHERKQSIIRDARECLELADNNLRLLDALTHHVDRPEPRGRASHAPHFVHEYNATATDDDFDDVDSTPEDRLRIDRELAEQYPNEFVEFKMSGKDVDALGNEIDVDSEDVVHRGYLDGDLIMEIDPDHDDIWIVNADGLTWSGTFEEMERRLFVIAINNNMIKIRTM